jgi:hypothetical protein
MNYVLPNRKAFADAITRTLLKYRKVPTDSEDAEVDLCAGIGGNNARELLPHQKVVREYLLAETPYRGLLLYHGLGSGKTCSSIAVAESLLSTRKVFVFLPASLQSNYRGELRKCGDPIYMYDQHWVQQTLTAESRKTAKALGLSDGFLSEYKTFFTSTPGEASNFSTLPIEAKKIIGKQIEDLIDQRFTFIRYNGISSANIGKYVPEDGTNPYSDSVVIIDEVHNLISRVSNESDVARPIYDLIYKAVNCKVVALSGTPVINKPNEVAFLMNLLRGPIERIIIPVTAIPLWDEEKMTVLLRDIPDVDTIEFNPVKKTILLTRNPPHFKSVYSEKKERIAVQYVKDLPWIPIAKDWVASFSSKFQTDVGGAELGMDRISSEFFDCLPTDYEEFAKLFLEGLSIKNGLLLQRRIQGLVSYFKGADERMLPRRIEDDKILEKISMSSEMFNNYMDIRSEEVKRDARRSNPMKAGDSEMASFRVNSRLACNYAIPPELREKNKEAKTENDVPEKVDILTVIKSNPEKYLTEKGLELYSPKMLKILKNIQTEGVEKNQLLYSAYKELEGTGIFTAILDTNGWQSYRIIQDAAGNWIEDPTMDKEKPAYGLFVGGTGMVSKDIKSEFSTVARDAKKQSSINSEVREYMRQIFNGVGFSDDFPPSLKASVESQPKKRLNLFIITSAGAEGITLANVRRVHIMEPHWNPARHDQVIGRAIRICSHSRLPLEDRTVRVSFYLSVLTESQKKSTQGNNIVMVRRADTTTKRYEGEPSEVFMSTDEYLYEKTWEKDRINSRISLLLKQAAVDCEVHRRLHSRETPVITCMRFDSSVGGEDLAFKANLKQDDLDITYLRNMSQKKRTLKKVSIKSMVFLIDDITKEVFDGPAFEDKNRLMRMGILTSPFQIQWLPDLRIG